MGWVESGDDTQYHAAIVDKSNIRENFLIWKREGNKLYQSI